MERLERDKIALGNARSSRLGDFRSGYDPHSRVSLIGCFEDGSTGASNLALCATSALPGIMNAGKVALCTLVSGCRRGLMLSTKAFLAASRKVTQIGLADGLFAGRRQIAHRPTYATAGA